MNLTPKLPKKHIIHKLTVRIKKNLYGLLSFIKNFSVIFISIVRLFYKFAIEFIREIQGD